VANAWGWSEKNQSSWRTTRAKGRQHFVLVMGVLAWGGPMFLIMAGGPAVFGWPYPVSATPWYWLGQIVLWTTAGFFYGLWVWHASEEKYRRYEQETPNT
jgi:hypothetical protein